MPTDPANDVLLQRWSSVRERIAAGGADGVLLGGGSDLAYLTGYGDNFIHRTGHGIGVEVHEPPYVTELNDDPIQVGHAFSIEPGIYLAGEWGMRLEDIVVIEAEGARRCNHSTRSLIEV